jgi:hypothetical protein
MTGLGRPGGGITSHGRMFMTPTSNKKTSPTTKATTLSDFDRPMTCEWCGGAIDQAYWRRRFCSDTCRYASRDRHRGHLAAGSTITVVCIDCGKPFTHVVRKRRAKRCPSCASRPAKQKGVRQ